ncbi:hypothetical protein [Catenuloplanes atrovinosus]|uniref:Uncharacterized protein n=1 Tax=Catenuloplanes atrovinosus TaxID=137266 RepID=A0AAE3YS06_9ACTN|nr:hypothetical protein [Catenuloplanes atrovinosus]MDR7277562.1 hypothetical protein [Catenuloplanes atrovinosus]
MKNDNEEAEARRMLAPLAEDPPTDPRIDVDETMRVGTRRRRTRTVAGGATFAAVLAVTAGVGLASLPGGGSAGTPVAAGSSAPVPPPVPVGVGEPAPEGAACAVTEFAARAGTPMAVDRTGRWTVVSEGKYGTSYLLDNGAEVGQVPPAPGVDGDGSVLIVTDINSSGTFVAWAYAPSQTSRAYAYVDNTPTPLKGEQAQAVAVAETGTAIGGKAGERPVVWATPAAEPTQLALPEGYRSGEVVALGDDGKSVLGTIGRGETTEITLDGAVGTGVIWPSADADPAFLPLPEGAEWVRPTAMRGDWVVGLVSDGSAFRYHVPTKKIERLPAQIIWPSDVATDGTVAGTAVSAPIVFSRGHHAVLLVGGEVRVLDPDAAEGTLYELIGLSENRVVTGYVMPPEATGTPFRSTCA